MSVQAVAKTKVCGVTRPEDVMVCADAGVNFIGFNIACGPRCISVAQATALCGQVPAAVAPVLLLVDADYETTMAAVAATGVGIVQLHGSESPELVAQLRQNVQVFKAFRVRDAATLDALAAYDADAFVLDAYVPGHAGGTGASWDHSLLAQRSFSAPIMLAGGLTPVTVADAITTTRPWAVDTASGVESEPGIKNAALVQAFVSKAHAL